MEIVSDWERSQVVSRNGSLVMQADVFYGSFDQFSERVGGYGACSILALTIAQWMVSNPRSTLSMADFDGLIIDGNKSYTLTIICLEIKKNASFILLLEILSTFVMLRKQP